MTRDQMLQMLATATEYVSDPPRHWLAKGFTLDDALAAAREELGY